MINKEIFRKQLDSICEKHLPKGYRCIFRTMDDFNTYEKEVYAFNYSIRIGKYHFDYEHPKVLQRDIDFYIHERDLKYLKDRFNGAVKELDRYKSKKRKCFHISEVI